MTNKNLSSERSTLEALLSHLDRVRDQLPTDDARRRAEILLSGRENLGSLDAASIEDYRVAVEAFCFVNDRHDVLRDSGVEHAYNYRDSYPQQARPATDALGAAASPQRYRLLGREIGFPIGVPASVLTADSNWVRFFAEHGFNVLTFKTVRSRFWDPNPFPNWVFLEDADEPLRVGVDPRKITVHGDDDTYLRRLRAFSTANSFGVPSSEPSVWQAEVAKSVELLGPDKLLIVSVMGTATADDPADTLRDDFVEVARLAAAAGAPAIELNLSCPNTLDPSATDSGVKPPLCHSVEDTLEVVAAVATALDGKVPLVAKLSYMPLPELRPLVRALAPYVSAISGINTLQVRVESRSGGATFGERKLAGLSGIAIRNLAVDFARSLDAIRAQDGLAYDIIAMGGVMDAADVHALRAVGADAVQTATAASVNPRLPRELIDASQADAAHDAAIVEKLRETLFDDRGEFRSPAELADLLGFDRAVIERELNPLGELDLPRRAFELLAVGMKEPAGHAELDLEEWGAGPSPRRLAELEQTTQRRLERERSRLLGRSTSPEVVAEHLGWKVDQVNRALDDGELIYLDWGGRRLVPLWQFTDDDQGRGRPLPGLPELRQVFARDIVALDAWVTSANASLGGRVPRDVLAEGDTRSVLDSLLALGTAR